MKTLHIPFEFDWVTAIDVFLVYLIIYFALSWLKNTRSFNLIRGLLLILAVYAASFLLRFHTLNWLLGKFANALILIMIIVFQPEIRRVLERIGQGSLFSTFVLPNALQSTFMIKQILKAVDTLAKHKIGALIVVEVGVNLNEFADTGVLLEAELSSELLTSLFWPNSPTHDGAVIIRQHKVLAADCLLPLTESKIADRRVGTRHRAALGLSEQTDALVIVISEETGVISIAENGNLTRFLTKEALETRLFNLYTERQTHQKPGIVSFLSEVFNKGVA